jgi:hypothetical protein
VVREDTDTLVVYVQIDRVTENLETLGDRIEDTYEFPVDVRPGAPVPAGA